MILNTKALPTDHPPKGRKQTPLEDGALRDPEEGSKNKTRVEELYKQKFNNNLKNIVQNIVQHIMKAIKIIKAIKSFIMLTVQK